MSRTRRQFVRFALSLAIVAIAFASWWFLRSWFTLDELVAREDQLRGWIRQRQVWSIVLGTLLFAIASLVPGTPGKSFVFGWLFGFWRGVMVVNLGSTLGGCAAFLVCRYLLREMVQRRLGFVLRRAERALERDGTTYVLMSRLFFAPFTIMNYALSCTRLRLRTFLWTTQVGMLPTNIVMVYASSQLPSLRQLAEQGPLCLWSPRLGVAFVLLSILPLLTRKLAQMIWPRVVPTPSA